MVDAGLLEVEAGCHRSAARGDEEIATVDRLLAGPGPDNDANAAAARLDPQDRRGGANVHAVAGETVEDDAGELGIVTAQGTRCLNHRDRRAEAPDRLGEFQPNGAAADDDEVGRLARELEDRLVGMEGNVAQAGDVGHGGHGAGGDDEAPRLHDAVTNDDGAPVLERASPGITTTPIARKRSAESVGAMPSITSRT